MYTNRFPCVFPCEVVRTFFTAIKFKGTFMLGEIPSTGDVLRLLVDPKDPRHFATASSLRR
jgi:hypothetical protein